MCFDMSYLIFSTIVVLISVTSTTHGAYREYTPVLITSLSLHRSPRVMANYLQLSIYGGGINKTC